MSLVLVTGPANAAKAGEVFSAFRARLARGPLLVVPTRADVAAYERELATDGALVGGRVTSFGGLVREIARRAGWGRPVVGRLAREVLVADAVGATPLTALAASARSAGFVAEVGALLAELRSERADPGPLGREVAEIARGYAARLERAGRTDEEGFVWGALDALRARPARWGDTPVLLYGFDDLTTPQRDAVETLARPVGAEVWVSLPYEPRAAFAGRARTVEELRPLADRELALAAREDFYAPASRAALHRLERGLFEPPEAEAPTELRLWEEDAPAAAHLPAAGEAITVLAAGGERAEAELVAASVAGLLADGHRPDEVAVVHPAAGRAAPLLLGALAACGVPATAEREVPAGHRSLGAALAGLVRAALVPDAPAEALLAWLRAPGLLTRPENADALELACRRERIPDAAAARERWQADVPNFPLDALDRVAEAHARNAPALLAELRRQAERLWVDSERRAPDPETAPVFAALASALDELGDLAARGIAAAGPAELADALVRLPVTLGDAGAPDAVLVADPLGIRARRFRAVVVAGLQDGAFPRRARPAPFLGEEERAALRLGPAPDPLAEDRYLFYAAVSRATERVLLSHRVSDEEGNAELPSPFLADVQALFASLRTVSRPLAEVTWPLATAPTEHERERARAAAAPRERAPGLGDLGSPAVRQLVRHGRILSAGAAEAYAQCPVSWLVERQLAPEALEPEPEPFARGGFNHAVLERTLTALREETGAARITEANLPRAEALLDVAIAAERGRLEAVLPPALAPAALRTARADVLRALRAARAEAGLPWAPDAFEVRFGFDDDEPSEPALVLGHGEEEVRVRGAIDRVDLDPGGRALVRDYKSGRAGSDWPGRCWVDSDRLQVALYMLAARRLLGHEPAGGVYQPLRGDDERKLRPRGLVPDEPEVAASGAFVATDLVTPEEIDAILDATEKRVVALAGELRAGRLEPRPETCAGGRGCRYPGICRSTV